MLSHQANRPYADSIRRQVASGVSYRALTASSYDPQSRTVDLVAVTETPVRMPGWRIGIEGDFFEILDVSAAAVDLSAVSAGNCPLLDSHNSYELAARLGAISSARIAGNQLIVTANFGESDPARSAEAEMGGAIPPKVSAGYRVAEYQFVRFEADRTPVYRATKWALNEVSLVAKGADPNAGIRSGDGDVPCIVRGDDGPHASAPAGGGQGGGEGQRHAPAGHGAISQPAPTISIGEALQLQDQARALGVENQVRGAFDAPHANSASIGAAILAAAAVRQAASTGGIAAGGAGRVVVDERDSARSGIETAILLGIGSPVRGADGQPDQARIGMARAYRGMTISELAATCIGERNLPRSTAEREAIYTRAFMAASDFPLLLSNALNQRLLEQYQVAEPIYRRIAQQITFADFRAHDMLRAGDFPALQPISENGEIKFGSFTEKKETASVTPYAIQFGLSRQLMVNDRLNAIEQMLSSQGVQVALFEEKTFFAMKAVGSGAGPTLVEGAARVFTSGHSNLAGSGSAITNASLSAGRAAIRKQKNLQGDQMGLPPAILLVSPDKETEASAILYPLQGANQATSVNIFAGKLELIVGGQLNGTPWELYTDPVFGSNWVWGLLDGYQAPRLKVEPAFGTQGVKVSLEHDFGCGAQDFRFGYRDPGA